MTRLNVGQTRIFRLVKLLMIGCIWLSSCKKKESPPPDLAAQVIGSYKVTAIGNLPNNLPATPTAASIVITRNGDALDQVLVKASYALVSTNSSQGLSDTKTISLQQSNNNIDLYDGTAKVATASNNSIFATDYPFLTAKISFTATKQ